MAAGGNSKAVLTAFFGNSAVAATKFVAYLFTQSSSMLAESIHSVADAGNQALLLHGARQSRKVADDEHQFGYGLSGLIHLRTQHLGPDDLLVGAKVGFESSLSVQELADAINGGEAAVRARIPPARYLYIEPDLLRPVDSSRVVRTD